MPKSRGGVLAFPVESRILFFRSKRVILGTALARKFTVCQFGTLISRSSATMSDYLQTLCFSSAQENTLF